MLDWLLILTLSTHSGVAIKTIEMPNAESCEKAGEEYEFRFKNRPQEAIFVCIKRKK